MRQYTTPDAAESSAGDDFHILWAIQKSLRLINFDAMGLKAIAIENLSNSDSSYLDTSGGMSLGVDLTEYYGGQNFANASKVVVSQLKYSTRTPDKNWTVARICTSRKNSVEGSIIDRLASFYRELSGQFERDELLNKLQIKLVSNRPAAPKLISLIEAVKNFSRLQYPEIVDINSVKTTLDPSQQIELARLVRASKLTGSLIVDFISVLDFTDCGEGSRFEIEQKITTAISSLTSYQSSQEYNHLHKLVWGKMMPEQRLLNTICLADVLYAFGVHDLTAIFPVKNEIARPDHLVVREQLSAIATEILSEENYLICLHGGAGIGKSTLVNMIPDVLPAHSVTIVFDCYGGGSYLDPEDRRHKHAAGIMQLCNELSLKTGSDLLLTAIGTDEFYLRQFKMRAESALKVIQSLNRDAVLAIILDAADNSVTAADVFDGRTFVKDLVNMEFPQGCKIIVAARTERVVTLELPSHAKQVLLQPFSYNETVTFLDHQFISFSEHEVEEFIKLTHATPRVMAYALELPGKTLAQKMIPLKPNGRTLEQIFRLRVKQAERSSSRKDVTIFLKNLIALPRPIPFELIKSATALSDQNLNDIRVDLWREVLEQRQEFTFRDEDFETYLRKTYKVDKDDYIQIARILLAQADENDYASTHLANFLSKAEMYVTLKDIVIDKKYLSYPMDPVKNKEVFIARAKMAMKNTSKNFHPQDFVKLMIVSAEAAKINKVLEDILFEQPNLAANYGNLQTNQKIYFQSGNPGWFGQVHYRNAAIYARSPQTADLAKQHLEKATEWAAYRRKLDDEQREEYRLVASDLANGAEANLHLYGAEKAVEWIKGWKPRQALYDVVEILLKNLIETGKIALASEWLRKNGDHLRIDTKLLIVKTYFLSGLKTPLDVGKMLGQILILSRLKEKRHDELLCTLMAFCEYCLKTGIAYENVKHALILIEVAAPDYPPGFFSREKSEVVRLDLLLRKGIVLHLFEARSFLNRDFYPHDLLAPFENLESRVKEEVEDKRKRFDRIFKHLLPTYVIRATYFFKNHSSKSLLPEIEKLLKNFYNDWELNHYQRHDAPALQKFILLKLLDIAFYQNADVLVRLLIKHIISKELKSVDLLLSICEKLIVKKHFRESVGLILGHVEETIDSAKLAGRELVEHYTRAAVIGSICSLQTGKYYFDKMVTASGEIDFEAFDQIRSVRDLTEQMSPLNNPDLAIKFFRYGEYCADRLRNWDGFPWHLMVPVLGRLDIRTAFAAVCQWDHRGVKPTSKHFIELIFEALDQDFMPADIGAAMLAMNRYYYPDLTKYEGLLIEKLDQKRDHKLKNEVLRQLIRDIKFHRPDKNAFYAREFLSLIENGRFTDRDIIKDLEKYIDDLESIVGRPDKEYTTERFKDQRGYSYQELIKNQIVDESILRSLILVITSSGDSIVVNFQKLFEDIAFGASEQHHIVYLDALINLEERHICYHDFESGLKVLVTAWKKNYNVITWTQSAFVKIVHKWFHIYFGDDYFSYEQLKKLAELLEIKDFDFAMGLVKIIPERLDELSSGILYQMLKVVYPLLDSSERQPTLAWMLSRWVDRVPEDYAFTDSRGILNNGSPEEILGYFIRYNLGHPKKSVRWITAHILRRLARLKNGSLLKILFDLQNEQTCHPFQDQQNPFYWISSKLYLWIAVARISKESPEMIIPLSGYIIAEIRNSDLPHAQIRYFVQSAAKAISIYDSNIFSVQQTAEIQQALSSPFEIKKVKAYSHPRDEEQIELRFDFDKMDTLQYWYAPLGRIFKLGSHAVASIADRYISEHWGYVGDVRKDNHVRSSDYMETSNRHGSEPSVENLRAYYEYHAMFCAATTLLYTRPLVMVQDDWRETWEQWLTGWALCREDFWLSDFNETVPLVKKYWLNTRDEHPDWEWEIKKEDFDEVLGLNDQETVVMHLGARCTMGKDYETLSLRSGLVTPRTAGALLRMFQTTSANDHYINFENDRNYDDDHEKDMSKKTVQMFKLDGWLFEEKTRVDGIDDNDPLFKNISKARIRPGKLFLQWSKCKLTPDFSFTYREEQGRDVWLSQFTTWSDSNEKSSYGDFRCNGEMLRMKRDELKSFLKDIDKDLIVEIEIKRNVDKRNDTYYPPYNRVYLFKANGRIETISGDYRSW